MIPNPEDIKIPEKERGMIDVSIRDGFKNLSEIQVQLFNVMLETIYKCGVNDGLQMALKEIKQAHGDDKKVGDDTEVVSEDIRSTTGGGGHKEGDGQ